MADIETFDALQIRHIQKFAQFVQPQLLPALLHFALLQGQQRVALPHFQPLLALAAGG